MQQNTQPSLSQKSIRRHRPFYKLPLFWATLIVLIVAGVIIVPRVLARPAPAADGPAATTASSSSVSSSSSRSQEAKPATDATTPDSDGKTPAKYEGEDPNTSASLTGSLTTARFSGDKLIVRVNIDQYLSSGTCVLTISDGTSQLEKTARLIPSAATSTCEGFDLPSAELANFSRPLSISISLTSGDKTGTIEGNVE